MLPASRIRYGAIVLLLVLLLLLSSPWNLPSPSPEAEAWGATDVHAFITRQAALLWLRSYPQDALLLIGGSFDPQPLLDALVRGEAAEDGVGLSLAEMVDQMPWLSHFYDPSRGGVGFSNPLTVALGFPLEPPGALEKALQDPSFGWTSLLGEFRDGLREKADLTAQWEKLGHILHLLEDMSMPAHVRNDGHAGLPVVATALYPLLYLLAKERLQEQGISSVELAASIYRMGSDELERYGEKAVGQDPGGVDRPDEGSFLRSLLPESPSFLPEANDPTPYFQQLAEFTNTHFLSQDTAFQTYPQPPSPAESDRYQWVLEENDQGIYVCYLLDTVAGRTFHLARGGYFATRETMKSLGLGGRMKAWWKAVQHIGWGLDETCYRDYLEILVPRAIADTAGLLHTLAVQVGEGDETGAALFPVKVEGKRGFIDKSGQIVIIPRFDIAGDFSEGLAVTRVGGVGDKFGFIDMKGKMVIEPQFDMAYSFSEGLAQVRLGDSETGKCNFIDKSGEVVIEPQVDWAQSFSEGLAQVRIGDSETGKRGFIDKSGEMVIEPRYDFAHDFHEGLAGVELGKKWGFIDKTGKMVIEPQFDYAWDFSEELAVVRLGDGETAQEAFIDKSGEMVLEPQVAFFSSFSAGLAGIYLGGKWGFIDKTGKMVIEPQFDWYDGYLPSFSEGLAVVKVGGLWGFIDTTGKMVIEPQFNEAVDFHEGLAWVIANPIAGWGYIDHTGRYIWGPTE